MYITEQMRSEMRQGNYDNMDSKGLKTSEFDAPYAKGDDVTGKANAVPLPGESVYDQGDEKSRTGRNDSTPSGENVYDEGSEVVSAAHSQAASKLATLAESAYEEPSESPVDFFNTQRKPRVGNTPL